MPGTCHLFTLKLGNIATETSFKLDSQLSSVLCDQWESDLPALCLQCFCLLQYLEALALTVHCLLQSHSDFKVPAKARLPA